MNILTRINNFTSLSDVRLKQLDKKEAQHIYLYKHRDMCSNTIIKYFINEHRINRLQAKILYDDTFLNFFENTKNNLDTIEYHTNKFDEVIRAPNFCQELDIFIKYQERLIGKLKTKINNA